MGWLERADRRNQALAERDNEQRIDTSPRNLFIYLGVAVGIGLIFSIATGVWAYFIGIGLMALLGGGVALGLRRTYDNIDQRNRR